MHDLLLHHSHLPPLLPPARTLPGSQSLQRLCDEGEIFTGAGSETTARTLTTILFHLTDHPECLSRLQAELKEVMPDLDQLVSWTQLSNLPYLSAIIQEGLRLSYGVTTRLPRVSPQPLRYKDWSIPAGTPVSETPYFVLVEPSIFPEPDIFRPDRWMGDSGQRLDRYQVSFGKGSRQCIGMNLAYAEMYLTVAAIFRRFSFELYDTSFEDIKIVHDYFVAAPADPSRGVNVKVVAATD